MYISDVSRVQEYRRDIAEISPLLQQVELLLLLRVSEALRRIHLRQLGDHLIRRGTYLAEISRDLAARSLGEISRRYP